MCSRKLRDSGSRHLSEKTGESSEERYNLMQNGASYITLPFYTVALTSLQTCNGHQSAVLMFVHFLFLNSSSAVFLRCLCTDVFRNNTRFFLHYLPVSMHLCQSTIKKPVLIWSFVINFPQISSISLCMWGVEESQNKCHFYLISWSFPSHCVFVALLHFFLWKSLWFFFFNYKFVGFSLMFFFFSFLACHPLFNKIRFVNPDKPLFSVIIIVWVFFFFCLFRLFFSNRRCAW